MSSVYRKCLMMSDLQSGAEEIEYVLRKDYDALSAENAALKARLAEHDRLHAELNAALHPNGDGPAHPSLCDLVAYARGDQARLAEAHDNLEACAIAMENAQSACITDWSLLTKAIRDFLSTPSQPNAVVWCAHGLLPGTCMECRATDNGTAP